MRILVVEDEHKIADSIKRGLEQEGMAVDVSYDGKDGYDLAISENYDILVLDIMLPNISGLEILDKLKSKKNQIPILMLTARSTLDDKVLGLNNGADDYLTKPFEFDELLARIKALARRPKESLSNILFCGDLTLDTTTYKVTRNEAEISLSKKEYALLELLMRNKNRILTKDEIIQKAWNFDDDILPNTIEVYIGYIRNKIEKPFKSSPTLIKTIRGFGYKIEDSKTKKS